MRKNTGGITGAALSSAWKMTVLSPNFRLNIRRRLEFRLENDCFKPELQVKHQAPPGVPPDMRQNMRQRRSFRRSFRRSYSESRLNVRLQPGKQPGLLPKTAKITAKCTATAWKTPALWTLAKTIKIDYCFSQLNGTLNS